MQALETLLRWMKLGAFTGIQLYVENRNGDIIEENLGIVAPGSPMSGDIVYPLYCSSKPIVSLAAGLLATEGFCSMATPVSEILGRSACSDQLTLVDVVMERANLRRPTAIEAMLLDRRRLRARLEHELSMASSGIFAVSEFVSGWVIGEVIRKTTGLQPAEFVRSRILEPLGIGRELLFDAPRPEAIGPFVVDLPSKPRYLYHERLDQFRSHERMAAGAYGSARGLGRFHAWQLHTRQHHESPAELSGSLERASALLGSPDTVSFYDSLLKEVVTIDGGQQCVSHWHPALSDRAIGHGGLLGTSFGFSDVGLGVAGAVIVNSIHRRPEVFRRLRASVLNLFVGTQPVP